MTGNKRVKLSGLRAYQGRIEEHICKLEKDKKKYKNDEDMLKYYDKIIEDNWVLKEKINDAVDKMISRIIYEDGQL